MAAATALHSEGIATLGTALFSVHQALAASQAGMYAISLYLNEPRAHTEVAMWPDVADPATEAPMAARHVQIRSIYNQLAKATGKPQPQMKTASFCVPADVLACASLGADHVTVSIPVLNDLNAFSTLPDYRSGMWQVPFTEQARSDDGSRVWHTWVPRKWADPEIQALLAHDPLSAVPKEEWKLPNPHGNYLAPGVVDALNEADPATRDRLKFALAMFTGMEEQSRVFLEGRQAKLNA
jgi:transaldolase